MTRIADLLHRGPTTSLEFMPPRTDAGEARLRATLHDLADLEPSFVSVTYGAGGSTRDRTHEIVVDLLDELTPMAHLTTWGHTRAELVRIIRSYHEAGVRNLLALRGDAPRSHPDLPVGDLPHALALVRLIREVAGEDPSIGVAVQPQVHPTSPDRATDRRHLAAKLAEADFGITQFFFETHEYVRMMEELAALDCTTPVIPGIMPITDVAQVERFAELSGAPVPVDLARRLHAVADDPTEVRRIGIDHATTLCAELLEAGAPGLHHYTLNRSTATLEVHGRLAVAAAPA